HLAQVLGLAGLFAFSALFGMFRRPGDPAKLGDAFYEVCDVGAKEIGDVFDRAVGVLNDVVQQCGGECRGSKLHTRQNDGDFDRVGDVELAGAPARIAVSVTRIRMRALYESSVDIWVFAADDIQQVVEGDAAGL